jgi:AcrR family transcriptional regulator
MTDPKQTAVHRPLRADAERNRKRILRAAAEVFTTRGLQASLDDVARQAGVGVGTVYRRFPDKEALVAALFLERIDNLVTVAEDACAAADPWQAIVSYLEYAAAAMAGDLGLRQLMMFGTYDRDQVCYARDRMRPVITRLVERAKASGDLRADFEAPDVKMIAFMLGSLAEYAAAVTPDVWRRYLAMLIDGLRPSRDAASPLPVPAPTVQQLADLMRGQRR